MRILNYEIEFHTRARNKFTHFKIHKHETYRHICWWKFSLIYGHPHLMPMTVCADCYEEIDGKSAGDESWSWCEGCQQVEGDTLEIITEEYEAHHA